LSESYVASAYIRLNLADPEGAAKDAEELPQLQPENPDSYTMSASLLIQCAKKVPSDRQAHFYARATEILREGVVGQKLDPSLLKRNTFDIIRDREDFPRISPAPKSPVAL
jgi:hypothetical protein